MTVYNKYMSETFSTKKSAKIESLADDIEVSAERRKMNNKIISSENQDGALNNSQRSAIGDNNNRQTIISSSSYGLLALFFGWLGVHDFRAERYGYGCVHLIMAAIALCVLPFNISSFLPPTLLFVSWLWAIWEAIRFKKTSNALHVQTHEVKIRDYAIKAKVTEFFVIVAIVAVIAAIYFVISSKNCYASGCSDAGWAIAITIGIGFIPFMVAVILLIGDFVSYYRMPEALKKNSTLKNHTITMCCLGSILLIATIALIIFFVMA